TEEGPPVLALALTLQWVQVTIGVFYVALTGRPVQATLGSDWEPMVYIGLACVVALVFGLRFGRYLIGRLRPFAGDLPPHALSLPQLLTVYAISISVVGVLQQTTEIYPSIRQGLVALAYMRLGVLYLVLRRFVFAGRWTVVGGILLFEIGLG